MVTPTTAPFKGIKEEARVSQFNDDDTADPKATTLPLTQKSAKRLVAHRVIFAIRAMGSDGIEQQRAALTRVYEQVLTVVDPTFASFLLYGARGTRQLESYNDAVPALPMQPDPVEGKSQDLAQLFRQALHISEGRSVLYVVDSHDELADLGELPMRETLDALCHCAYGATYGDGSTRGPLCVLYPTGTNQRDGGVPEVWRRLSAETERRGGLYHNLMLVRGPVDRADWIRLAVADCFNAFEAASQQRRH